MTSISSTEGSEERLERVTATADEVGQRLDRFLATRISDLSRSRLKTLIIAGAVSIGGRTIIDPERRVNAGETVDIQVPPAEPAKPAPEAIPLSVVYEDADLIVIDKPPGLVVHPAAGNWTGTLVNALVAHCGDTLSGIGGERRPGIVHRLDKDTSGLMVVAKNDRSHRRLAAQFAEHGREGGPLRRSYFAFVWGVPDRPRGVINAPLDRHPQARDKQAVRKGGREAITHWILREQYAGTDGRTAASLIDCTLETGRTHQIRVHLAHIGHPLLGDAVYGSGFKTKAAHLLEPARAALDALNRQALHAHLLVFEHPKNETILEFHSELPDDLARLRNALADEHGGGSSKSVYDQ
ncbi:MAG: rRNA synthase [Variibacter sp.]|jgi:23S rRNA pseudouridine1911/1915/1917 synthase|nr:rRNA synthase [Variibacter sp.]